LLTPPLELAARHSAAHGAYALRLLDAFGVTVKSESGDQPGTRNILSARETEILRVVASGLSNRDIADTLFISEETVKTHLRRIFEKMGVSSRIQAVERGRQLDLI
jgi:LuxR family maltose regulon positive regulatory protein